MDFSEDQVLLNQFAPPPASGHAVRRPLAARRPFAPLIHLF